MKTLAIVPIVVLLTTTGASAGYLSEQQARQKAAVFLKGGVYGRTAKIAGSRIKKAQLIKAGEASACQRVLKNPVWRFHIVVPEIDLTNGILELDARSGAEECSPLPGIP
jgi:hypothetical protein